MLKSLQQQIERFFAPKLPSVGCEISCRHIALVRMNPRHRQEVERASLAALPENLVNPSLTAPMISSMDEFMEHLRQSFALAEMKTTRISLAIPDQAARISLHTLDHFSGNASEKARLLKWKMKKTVPFNVEESRLSFTENRRPDGKTVVLAVCIYTPILEQVEECFEKLGIRVGWVTLASLASLELFARAQGAFEGETVLLVNLRPEGAAILLIENGAVMLFRQNQVPIVMETESSKLAGPEQLYQELHPCLMYYQDKFEDSAIRRICLASSQPLPRRFSEDLSEKTGLPVTLLDPFSTLSPRAASRLPLQKNALIPALGLALGKY